MHCPSRRRWYVLPALLLAAGAPALQARTLMARIDRVQTAVAELRGVTVRLDWPAQATQGRLLLTARDVDAADLGYRFRDLRWQCPLQRDGRGGWRCNGPLRGGRGAPFQLALALGRASTDAVLTRGGTRMAVQRTAAAPDLTRIDLAQVPVQWAQALVDQAWRDGRLKSGRLDGRLDVESKPGRPLRVAGVLGVRGLGLETPDAGIAMEGLNGRLRVDYRKTPALGLLALDGDLRGGEFLAGNTYLALPDTPIRVGIDGQQRRGEGWRLPRVEWRDGNALVATGSAAFTRDARLDALRIHLSSGDVSPLRDRYLSGWFGQFGLKDAELRGAMDLDLAVDGGRLVAADARLHGVDLRKPDDRFAFGGLDGDLRFSGGAPVQSELRWASGKLYGLDFGAARMPIDSRDGRLVFRDKVVIPAMGGTLALDGVTIQPQRGEEGADITFALDLDRIDFAQVAKALHLPAFEGTLSGRIPRARYHGQRLDFEGGLAMRMFDGDVRFSSLSLERPFGVAPSLSADIVFDDLDLAALTGILDFGGITGRLDGSILGLRLVDWTPVAFDARLVTDRRRGVKQRISQRAVQNISSVGDQSFMSSLQGRLIGFFDDFGYRRIGISCKLHNEVCRMGGLADRGAGFVIVEGAGIPRLTVVGFNRDVDWPTLVERLAAVGKGEVKPVVGDQGAPAAQ